VTDNVIFFGDSICFGEKVPPHRGWVTRLGATVENEFGGRFLVMNSSINGNTTRLALERMPFDVQRYGVTVLVVQFGLNDCNFWQTDAGVPRVSPSAFEQNLLEIVDRGRRFGARHVFLHTNHPTLRLHEMEYTGQPYEEGNRRYNQLIRKAATAADAELVDIEAAFEDSGFPLEELLLVDELHLSPAGHDLYYQIVEPRLLPVLRSVA
jgi:lysophospholipase L1-like esterase